jgi:hypothetical protein
MKDLSQPTRRETLLGGLGLGGAWLAARAPARGARYKAWSSSQVHNTGDGIYKQAGSAKAQLALSKRAGSKGYLGRITMGITT